MDTLNDCVLSILGHFNRFQHVKIMTISKLFLRMAKSNILWKTHFDEKFDRRLVFCYEKNYYMSYKQATLKEIRDGIFGWK